jgi:hypothetical protein
MSIITIGKRPVPLEQIALVEPFEPSSNPNFKPERDYKGRVLLLNRDSILTEQTPVSFAEQHAFEWLADDQIALNRLIPFKVETFEPREGFTPTRPFKTRLKWRDSSGLDQSKLLLTEPLTVAALMVKVPKRSSSEPRSARHEAGHAFRGSRCRRNRRVPRSKTGSNNAQGFACVAQRFFLSLSSVGAESAFGACHIRNKKDRDIVFWATESCEDGTVGSNNHAA